MDRSYGRGYYFDREGGGGRGRGLGNRPDHDQGRRHNFDDSSRHYDREEDRGRGRGHGHGRSPDSHSRQYRDNAPNPYNPRTTQNRSSNWETELSDPIPTPNRGGRGRGLGRGGGLGWGDPNDNDDPFDCQGPGGVSSEVKGYFETFHKHKVYLRQRLDEIRRQGKERQLEDEVEEIRHIFEVFSDINADQNLGIPILKGACDKIMDIMRNLAVPNAFPNNGSDDEEIPRRFVPRPDTGTPSDPLSDEESLPRNRNSSSYSAPEPAPTLVTNWDYRPERPSRATATTAIPHSFPPPTRAPPPPLRREEEFEYERRRERRRSSENPGPMRVPEIVPVVNQSGVRDYGHGLPPQQRSIPPAATMTMRSPMSNSRSPGHGEEIRSSPREQYIESEVRDPRHFDRQRQPQSQGHPQMRPDLQGQTQLHPPMRSDLGHMGDYPNPQMRRDFDQQRHHQGQGHPQMRPDLHGQTQLHPPMRSDLGHMGDDPNPQIRRDFDQQGQHQGRGHPQMRPDYQGQTQGYPQRGPDLGHQGQVGGHPHPQMLGRQGQGQGHTQMQPGFDHQGQNQGHQHVRPDFNYQGQNQRHQQMRPDFTYQGQSQGHPQTRPQSGYCDLNQQPVNQQNDFNGHFRNEGFPHPRYPNQSQSYPPMGMGDSRGPSLRPQQFPPRNPIPGQGQNGRPFPYPGYQNFPRPTRPGASASFGPAPPPEEAPVPRNFPDPFIPPRPQFDEAAMLRAVNQAAIQNFTAPRNSNPRFRQNGPGPRPRLPHPRSQGQGPRPRNRFPPPLSSPTPTRPPVPSTSTSGGAGSASSVLSEDESSLLASNQIPGRSRLAPKKLPTSKVPSSSTSSVVKKPKTHLDTVLDRVKSKVAVEPKKGSKLIDMRKNFQKTLPHLGRKPLRSNSGDQPSQPHLRTQSSIPSPAKITKKPRIANRLARATAENDVGEEHEIEEQENELNDEDEDDDDDEYDNAHSETTRKAQKSKTKVGNNKNDEGPGPSKVQSKKSGGGRGRGVEKTPPRPAPSVTKRQCTSSNGEEEGRKKRKRIFVQSSSEEEEIDEDTPEPIILQPIQIRRSSGSKSPPRNVAKKSWPPRKTPTKMAVPTGSDTSESQAIPESSSSLTTSKTTTSSAASAALSSTSTTSSSTMTISSSMTPSTTETTSSTTAVATTSKKSKSDTRTKNGKTKSKSTKNRNKDKEKKKSSSSRDAESTVLRNLRLNPPPGVIEYMEMPSPSRNIIGPNDIVTNPRLGKVKMETDYVPPVQMKTERVDNHGGDQDDDDGGATPVYHPFYQDENVPAPAPEENIEENGKGEIEGENSTQGNELEEFQRCKVEELDMIDNFEIEEIDLTSD